MDFAIWRSTSDDEFCIIKDPEITKSSELDRGIPRLASMESPARCNMDSAFPKDVRLSDNLYGATMPVISLRLRQMLESSVTNRVEYLPVALVNHKGRVEHTDYFVLHPLDVVDCIDLDASGVEWNRIAPDRISRCTSLVLKHDAIPKDYKLFRPQHWGRIILTRKDLVETLQKAELTGLYFRPTEGYKGIG